MRHRVHTSLFLKQEYSPHVSRLSAEPHRKFILTLTLTLLTLRTLMWQFIRVGKSNLDFHCSSWPRVYWTRLGKSWCADRAVRTGSVIWPWICRASLASYFAAFTLWHHHVAVTPITQPVSEIHVLSWTDLECQKRDKKQIEKRPILGSEVTHVVHVVLSKDGAAANGTVPGSTKYLRAPVRAPSGTFVPHGSERRTLGRSTQLPNGPRYPSTTTEDLLRQAARAFAAHGCTRAHMCCIPA